MGEYFGSRGIEFAEAYSGTQTRQRQTAEEVGAGIRVAGLAFPEVTTDPGWNEFDLDLIYREMVPSLCKEKTAFAREYEKMSEQLRSSADSPGADITGDGRLATCRWWMRGFAGAIRSAAKRGTRFERAWVAAGLICRRVLNRRAVKML